MKKLCKCLCLGLFCLATLLLTVSFAPKSYAATLQPDRPFSGSSCDPNYPEDTGLSYDADSYTIAYDNGGNGPAYNQPFGLFSLANTNAPAIGAVTCAGGVGGVIGLYVSTVSAGWYNLRTTVNGTTTQITPPSNVLFPSADGSTTQIELYAWNYAYPTNHQYTFQVQSCLSARWLSWCSSWSPSLTLTTATNRFCQNGYVWREASSFDLVCVTPNERSQVASDNSQANNRVNPNGSYGPHTCISGYVWRNAFGGDYVCVTPDQRTQVTSDNSQANNRIVAL